MWNRAVTGFPASLRRARDCSRVLCTDSAAVDGQVGFHHLAAPEFPRLGELGESAPELDGCRLERGARARRAPRSAGTTTRAPVRSATTRRKAAFRAPPPTRKTRCARVEGSRASESAPSKRLQTTPSTAARASCAGVTSARIPASVPLRIRSVRRSLAVQMRDQDQAASARRRLERQFARAAPRPRRAAERSSRSPSSRSWCRPAAGNVRSHRRTRRRYLSDRRTGSSLTVKAVPLVPRLRARSPGLQAEAQGGRHVVAGPRTHNARPCPATPRPRHGARGHRGVTASQSTSASTRSSRSYRYRASRG